MAYPPAAFNYGTNYNSFSPRPDFVEVDMDEDDGTKIDPQTSHPAISFSERSIRHAFIRKVYLILLAQLSVTFGFATLALLEPSVKAFLAENTVLVLVLGLLGFPIIIALFCCGLARVTPWNYLLLGVFTLSVSLMVGTIVGAYTVDSVLIALGITLLAFAILTLYACQTKTDFTVCGGVLLVALSIFFVAGIIFMFFPSFANAKLTQIIYGSIGALIFSVYIIYDTQLIMGGHKYQLGPEDYIFGAMALYLDIINLFLNILRVVGAARQ